MILCLTVQSYILLVPSIHSFFPADDTMPLFRTCSTSRHIYFARFVESISFLSAQQFCCIVCITFFWSLKHLGDYDLKVMRQEYYINRQKTVSSFSRYTYHADTFLYPFFLVFSYWFCPILDNIIKKDVLYMLSEVLSSCVNIIFLILVLPSNHSRTCRTVYHILSHLQQRNWDRNWHGWYLVAAMCY